MDTGVAIFDYADMVKKAVDKYDKNAISFADGISGQIDRNLEIPKWINKALFGNPTKANSTNNAGNAAPVSQPSATQQPATFTVKVFGESFDFDGEKMSEMSRGDVKDKDVIKWVEKVFNSYGGRLNIINDNGKFRIIIPTVTANGVHVSVLYVNNKNDDDSDRFDTEHAKEFWEKVGEAMNLNSGETVAVDGYGDSVLKITKTIKDGYPFLEFSAEKKSKINVGNGSLSSENGKIALTKDESNSIKKEIEGFKNPFRKGSNAKFVNDLLNLVNNEFGISGEITIPKEIIDSIKALTNDMRDIIISKFNDRDKMKNFLEKLLDMKNPISCIITI